MEPEKKRVGCLYRVSTKKQVNIEDDIPMQRNACMEFIKKREEWELNKEYIEPGDFSSGHFWPRQCCHSVRMPFILQSLPLLTIL